MNNELHERLGRIIDLLDEFIDEPELSDRDFHTLRPALETLNDVYDSYYAGPDDDLPEWARNAIDDEVII